MSPRTPCPDLARLKRFVYEPRSTPETDAVRGHLAQCEDCRAIVAGFDAGDGSKNTLADQPVISSRPESSSSAETMQVFRKRPIGGGPDREDMTPQTLADVAVDYPVRRLMPSIAAIDGLQGKDGDTIQPGADATVCFSPGTADHDQSFRLTEPGGQSNGTATNDSSETGCFLPGADAGRIGADGSSFNPTRVDAPVGLFARAGTLEGVTVPGYDILEELGRGGMGVVYKARHRRLQRMVALKMVLAGAHVGQVGLARFRAEAEAVAKLLHPNIVQIFETGEHEGRPFFSLEYVEGGSLDQRIAKSPTSPRGAAQLVETLARTMGVAHQRGIVHRDLKPANILLAKISSQSSMIRGRDTDSSSLPADHWSKNTVPKIADFGLAKRTDDDSSQTAERRDPRHAQLHGARTGGRKEPGNWTGRRHLCPGCDPL